MIIGLTGKRGSGKDTVASHLADKHGFSMLDFTRDVLAPILQKQGKPVTRDNLIDLGMEGRKKAHNGVWAEKLSVIIKRRGIGDYVISGVRFVEEVETFRKLLGEDFVLVSTLCDDRTRYERCRKRGTKGEGDLTFDQFMEHEKRPTEKVITETMKISDFVLDNNGTHEDLFSEADKVLKALKEKR
ncbi:MAG: AAA family ATPase [Candidatus Aenigmatarchaeota archaeon]|nr:MAG: AAA family ATPase [Candidatus Aenigmarchaeota archaeon]